MPTQSPAATRYAEAAFSLAAESGNEERWANDVSAAAEAFGAGGGAVFLADRKVSTDRKFAVIEQALAGALPEVRNLVKLLISRGRAETLPLVAERFRALWDEKRGVAQASVRTAVALDRGEQQQLTARLGEFTGKQIDLHAEVDPEILGGIVVRIGDTLIDGSARSRLLALKRQLEGPV